MTQRDVLVTKYGSVSQLSNWGQQGNDMKLRWSGRNLVAYCVGQADIHCLVAFRLHHWLKELGPAVLQ